MAVEFYVLENFSKLEFFWMKVATNSKDLRGSIQYVFTLLHRRIEHVGLKSLLEGCQRKQVQIDLMTYRVSRTPIYLLVSNS